MHALLQDLLVKKGIKSVTELSDEEKQTYDKWQQTLSDGEVTVEKIASLCEQQLSMINLLMKDRSKSDAEIAKLVLQFNVYQTIWDFMHSQKSEKENLIKYLDSLLTSEA